MNLIEMHILPPALRRELEKQSSHCDYCSEDVDSTELTSDNREICPDCLEDADPFLRLIDPDRAYDDMRDREMMRDN